MRPDDSFVGQPVRSLQTMLRVIEKNNAEPAPLIPDGFYGTQTRNAVERYQRHKGIPATGAADTDTWENIAVDYEEALIERLDAQPLQLILNPKQVIQANETHPYVYLVQVMLAAIEEAYGSVGRPPFSGTLDPATMTSVSAFQQLSQLPQTGEIDKTTWRHLALHYPLAVNKGFSQNRDIR